MMTLMTLRRCAELLLSPSGNTLIVYLSFIFLTYILFKDNITNTKTSQIREESSSKRPTRILRQNESLLMCLTGHKQLLRLRWPFLLEAKMARSISKTLLGWSNPLLPPQMGTRERRCLFNSCFPSQSLKIYRSVEKLLYEFFFRMTTEVENAQEIPSAAAEDKPDELVPAENVTKPAEGRHQ